MRRLPDAKACVVVGRAPGIVPWFSTGKDDHEQQRHGLSYRRSAYGAALTDNLATHSCTSTADIRGRWPAGSQISGAVAELATVTYGDRRPLRHQHLAHRTGTGGQAALAKPTWDTAAGERAGPGRCAIGHMVGTLFRTLNSSSGMGTTAPAPPAFTGAQLACPHLAATAPGADQAIFAARRVWGQWGVLAGCDAGRELRCSSSLRDVPFPIDRGLRGGRFRPQLQQGRQRPDKVVGAPRPLLGRRSLVRTAGMTVVQREAVVRRIVQAFLATKPCFVEQWDNYQPGSIRYGLGL